MGRGGRFGICILGVMLVLAGLAAAQRAGDGQGSPFAVASFTLRDVTAARNISELPVMFFAHNLNTREEERITQYTDTSGMFSYGLAPGNWILEFRVFDAPTNRFLYYSKNVINIQMADKHLNKTFYLTPVGSVDGSIVDSDNRPVGGAKLDIACAANLRYDDLPSTTTPLGSFHADILPVGPCTIYSTTGDLIGSADVDILQGERASMTIHLAKKNTAEDRWGVWAFALASLAIIIGIITAASFALRAKKGFGKRLDETDGSHDVMTVAVGRQEEVSISSPRGAAAPTDASDAFSARGHADEQTSENVNPRGRDVLRTLGDRESAIAKLLLDSGHETTQARIRNTLGIPKTSLARLLRSLEEKKVLHVDRIGNMKKVRLTDWFLGKG